MRAYHFLSTDNGLDDLKKKRIKLSEIDKLNDPFELWCFAQENRRTREMMQRWKTEMAGQYGILCFSRDWHNPLLWSHYADKHRGICLGFEVDEHLLNSITYVNNRTSFKTRPQTRR